MESSESFVVVFDVTSLSSYITAKELCKVLRGEGEEETEVVITLLGNKNYTPSEEREYSRAVATLSAMDFAEENKCLYFEVSALGGQNVLEAISETLRLAAEPILPQDASKYRHRGNAKHRAGRISKDRLDRLNVVATSAIK